MSDEPGNDAEIGRRQALGQVIKICGAAIAAAGIVPAAGMFLAPAVGAGTRQKRKVIFSTAGDMRSASFVAARYEGEEASEPGIFVRMVGSTPQVLSAKCTHAGCAVNWDETNDNFVCPCHHGRFDSSGKNIFGPPPSPLQRLEATMQGADLYVLDATA